MTVDEDLHGAILGLPPEAKEEFLKRAYAARQALVGAKGPLGLGTRKWPSPGTLAAHHEPTTGHQTPQLELLDRELVAVADGDCDRLMFYMPPQEGKSQRVSRRFAEWLLQADPTLRIAIVSYEAGRAVRWGRQIKRDAEASPELGIRLTEDSRAAGRWQTIVGGGVYCVGIGGPLTGEPVDVMIIDDPVKGRAEAESTVYREAAWEWWESTGRPRLSARGRVVLIMTRWHEDDLAGRLLVQEPGRWRVVAVPAIAEDLDPLGRKAGEPLLSVQDREPGYYTDLETITSQYVWLSIYQQRPSAAQGNLFLRSMWRYWHPAPDPYKIMVNGHGLLLSDMWRFATVDLAASVRTSADWTVASVWGAHFATGNLLLLDRVRIRVMEEAHSTVLLPLVSRWQLDTVFIERSFISTTLVRDLTREGVRTTPLDPDVDKVTRAIPYANRVKQGMVHLPANASWLEEWKDEHAQFPNAVHDDQVDTGAYAVRVVGTRWNPAGVASLPGPEPRGEDPDEPGFDYERQEW